MLGKSHGKRPLARTCHSSEDNIKINLREIQGCRLVRLGSTG